MAPRILKYGPPPCQQYRSWNNYRNQTVQIMKQLPQPIFRNMASLRFVHNHCRFGGASAALSKRQLTYWTEQSPRSSWTWLPELLISLRRTVTILSTCSSITYQVCRAGSSGTDCSIYTRCLWKICTQVNVWVQRLASDQATAKTGNRANEGPPSEVDRGAKERMPTDPRHDSQ
jgi:hypothetical protein